VYCRKRTLQVHFIHDKGIEITEGANSLEIVKGIVSRDVVLTETIDV
jgi:hypothetical protein